MNPETNLPTPPETQSTSTIHLPEHLHAFAMMFVTMQAQMLYGASDAAMLLSKVKFFKLLNNKEDCERLEQNYQLSLAAAKEQIVQYQAITSIPHN